MRQEASEQHGFIGTMATISRQQARGAIVLLLLLALWIGWKYLRMIHS